ncbi:YjbE family integral membrane protein [Devosia sp. UYZn731]|uniref:TerC family protein n=1 Tax=Devosia sp. UYZn731 TaxID=3156345 RepID=UPI003397EC05
MFFDAATISAYLEIITINIVLSGDNVVVIGMAAATLAPELRSKAILAGIAAATVIRIGFAVLATQLLAVPGLQLVGGLLLLWVCWKMYEELREQGQAHAPTAEVANLPRKTLRQAVTQIIIADVSMSLDNVLAVAGAAKQNITALVFGLVLSVVLMGLTASLVARILDRYRWIAWVGLLIIVYVAATMLYEGADQLMGHTLPNIPLLKG